jgi:hypothetical protein
MGLVLVVSAFREPFPRDIDLGGGALSAGNSQAERGDQNYRPKYIMDSANVLVKGASKNDAFSM